MTAETRQHNLIDGATSSWEVVIGLEVHAQVSSNAKLFSGASTEFGGAPNAQVSLVDAAMPGMLPVINEECVRQAIRTGFGLKAQINLYSVFDRKNYFYPDLPQGYQISQYKDPIVGEGVVLLDMKDGYHRRGRHRARASGAGRRQEPARPASGLYLCRPEPRRHRADGDRLAPRHALLRGGAHLCHQAALHPALSGHLRRQYGAGQPARRRERVGAGSPATRSARAARSRTSTPSASSGRPSKSRRAARSRFWRRAARSTRRRACSTPRPGETRSMRSKEEAHDYRYFPDPDLLPLELTQDWVDGSRRAAGAAGREEDALHRGVRPVGL